MLTVATRFPLQRGFCLAFVLIQPHPPPSPPHLTVGCRPADHPRRRAKKTSSAKRHSNMAACLNYHSTLETHGDERDPSAVERKSGSKSV